MKIDVDPNTLDGVVLAVLKQQLRAIRHAKFPSKHPEDIEFERDLIEAHKLLIKYYGG